MKWTTCPGCGQRVLANHLETDSGNCPICEERPLWDEGRDDADIVYRLRHYASDKMERRSSETTKLCAEAADRIELQSKALEWYAEQVAGCRKIGQLGDPFRIALDADGGLRAILALRTKEPSRG